MLKRAIFFIVGFFVLAVTLAQAQTETKVFRGSIGENRFQMTLKKDGDKLSGTYFYAKTGGELKLSGKIDAEGKFVLTETDAKGTKTGSFEGKWSKAEDEYGFSLTGTWKNSRGTKTLDFYATEQNIYFTGAEKLLTKTFSESNKTKLYEISADYPEVAGVNAATAANFNQLAKKRIDQQAANFRKMMLEQTAEDLKYIKELGVGNYLEISFNIEHADENIVSIGFFGSIFTGGAHPNHFTFPLNFDLKNNREIKLADLFKPNSAFLQKISAYCIKNLVPKLGDGSDEEWIRTGAEAKAENYKSWNLTREGLLITFDPYVVASYAAGPQEVLIPYAELKEILRADSVVKGLME